MIKWMMVAIIVIAVVIWCLIEQHLLVCHREDMQLQELPAEWENTRIVHISDLHHRKMGRDNCRIVQKVWKMHPDYIVITGDLVSRNEKTIDDAVKFVKKLAKLCPVYLCPGNHELDLPPDRLAQLRNGIEAVGGKYLWNTTACLEQPGKTHKIYLSGAALSSRIYRGEDRKFRHLERYTAERLETELKKPKGCTILLAHNPLLLDTYADWGADLVLSGHVHGGIIRLPFLGGILSPERRFFPKYSKGKYTKGKTKMYVSGGIGKLRLWNPPEIVCLTLHKQGEKN